MIPLQQSFSFTGMAEGTAILIIGILGLLLFATIKFRNPAAAVTWGLSVLLFILSGLLELGSELFWIGIMGTLILLIAGLVVRWSL